MRSSADQMAKLEEDLIHERSRAAEARERLARESERREATQGDLDKTKQVVREKFVCRNLLGGTRNGGAKQM